MNITTGTWWASTKNMINFETGITNSMSTGDTIYIYVHWYSYLTISLHLKQGKKIFRILFDQLSKSSLDNNGNGTLEACMYW